MLTFARSQSSCASTFTEKSCPIRSPLLGEMNFTLGAAVSLMQPKADGLGPPPQGPRAASIIWYEFWVCRSQRSPVTATA